MATPAQTFLIALYEEHLEEASFLYGLSRALLINPDISWKKIGEFEERLEAHIDGLVVGDKLAMEICGRRAVEGDFGELFTATCVFCRQGQRDRVLAIFDQLDPADAERAGAVADALKYELPDAWSQDFLSLLSSGDPKLAPILARAFGYRRLQCGPQLLTAMRRCSAAALTEVVWALGRIGYSPAAESLLGYLKSEDEPVRSAAAVALARLGEPRVVDVCLDQARPSSWSILPLALAGGRSVLSRLTEIATRGAGADCFTALGLIGDPASIPLLISSLERSDTAAHAAIALQCLTGAGLSETVFMPEQVEEDELFDSEREQLKQSKKPVRGDGSPFGSTVKRRSQSPDNWNTWWRANATRFTTGMRYRHGSPITPERLIEMLTAESTPHLLRRSCMEELVTRYGKDFGIETDMPVERQIIALEKAADWARSSGAQFREGAWYFCGSPL